MDRGYVDFERLYVFTLSAAFFVVRTKSNIVLQRRYSQSVDKTTGVAQTQNSRRKPPKNCTLAVWIRPQPHSKHICEIALSAVGSTKKR
jgi:hypothetical protein